MYQVMILLIFEGLKDLDWEPANQVLWNTLEIIVSDELIEVDGKKLESNYQMFTENLVVFYSDNIILIMLVVSVKILQYF